MRRDWLAAPSPREWSGTAMQIDWPDIVRRIFNEETAFWVAMLILVLGVVFGYLAWRWTKRLLRQAGIDDAVEGTPFERTARSFGTSTVGIVATLVAISVYAGAVILALSVVPLMDTALFWSRLTSYLPRLLVAALAIVVGLVLGDKAAVVVGERLRSVKLPEVGLIPVLVKYSVFFIAGLIALDQLGVAIEALLVLLAVYAFGLVFLSLVAFRDLLRSGAAGIYILLNQPYSIGDRVRIDGNEGIVQEVDMFTTHVEDDGEEYIIPNQTVFRSGIVRVRD